MANRWWLVALFVSVTCPTAWAQEPTGPEFRVNSYTTSSQGSPALASDASGNFVVVWESRYQDGSGDGVFGQRFNASGVPQGSEFQVNSYTRRDQYRPAVASDANGNFVVIWTSYSQFGNPSGIFGQRFNAAGGPQGSEFRVNSNTTGYVWLPAVASDANGNFVVVWAGQDGSSWGIFGQRFDAFGFPQGSELLVNSYTTGSQERPAATSAANGDFVVAWTSSFQDGSSWGVFGQRFNASGVPQGSEFQVSSFTTDSQAHPSAASDANGNFVVSWFSKGQDGSAYGIFGQRFDASGVPQGSEFQVNSYTTGYQTYSAVASDAGGNFVVVWRSWDQDASGYGIFGQRFNASGVPQGGEFLVNSYTTSHQGQPAVSSAANGNFVVAWISTHQDGGGFADVFGQRYGDLIFKNGFE